jgi:hypothetical protein
MVEASATRRADADEGVPNNVIRKARHGGRLEEKSAAAENSVETRCGCLD